MLIPLCPCLSSEFLVWAAETAAVLVPAWFSDLSLRSIRAVVGIHSNICDRLRLQNRSFVKYFYKYFWENPFRLIRLLPSDLDTKLLLLTL